MFAKLRVCARVTTHGHTYNGTFGNKFVSIVFFFSWQSKLVALDHNPRTWLLFVTMRSRMSLLLHRMMICLVDFIMIYLENI